MSTHPNSTSHIINPPYQRQTLHPISSQHPQFFPHFPTKHFPLLTKILHPTQSLSIHLHPHNSYPYHHQNPQYPKSQSSYIIHPQ
ncbi:type I phosphomannose isomerase catalytic subunit, partial [Staphylococcus aureus]|uniref:type I phosphomannose isomerase catalytic subunit n=1 Tax=Staphylococcus aureus TaxID=1280 RepID=UPI0037DA4A46